MAPGLTRFLFLLFATGFLSFNAAAQSPQLTYFAMPSGGEMVPAINNTNGKGLVTLLFSNDQTKVNISGMILNLEDDVTEVWLEAGPKGAVGSAFLNLSVMVDERRIQGDIDVPADLIKNLVFNNLYVVVKTAAYPEGEIRGQFMPETDRNFRSEMSGSQVVPATNSTGFAFGGIHFTLAATEIDYAFLISDLSGPVTETVFYEGDPGQNGTVVLTRGGSSGNLVFGLVDLGPDVLSFVEKCEQGKIYIVLKTDAFPNGEIRGQVQFLGNFNSFAPVNGVQAIPSEPSPGFGLNYTTPNATFDSLTTVVFVNGISPVSATINTGLPGSTGPVFAELDPTPVAGFYTKTYALTPPVLADFVNGRMYLNFGTTNKPNGEIRGVLRSNLRRGYAFDLCGSQVVPPNSSTALGMAMASVDVLDCYIDYKILIDGFLGGAPTSGAIRRGNVGENGIQLYSIPMNNLPFMADAHAIAAGEGTLIELEGAYMELYSPAFPDGEIRGQIRRKQTCPLLQSTVNELESIGGVAVFPVPFSDVLRVQLESFSAFDGKLILVNTLGQELLAQQVHITEGPQTLEMNTAALVPGIYQLVLQGVESKVLRIVVKG